MKMHIKNSFLLPVLVAGLGLILAGRVTAQTFTALHSFTAADFDRSNMPQGYPNIITNSDGAHPQARLILSGNTLYGTTPDGGPPGFGTVFAVNTDGTGFTNLHIFTAANYIDIGGAGNGVFINSDGIRPYAKLILSGNTLYGTAFGGGTSGSGTVFAINTDGTGFTTLHSFADPYPGPIAGLILSGNTLYGTTLQGGSLGFGTVFAVNTDGTSFTTLYSFTCGSDGCRPWAELILSGNTLYGTTSEGNSGYGTVFAVNTDGTGFTTLHSFAISVGAYPKARLILLGNTLYGTTTGGGSSFLGTVFAVKTDGTGFRKLHNFTGGSDESDPYAGLIASSSGKTLYGTASSLSHALGTVFAVNTNGTGFTTLYRFTGGSNGVRPMADLILSGNTLYGTASYGGTNGSGTVFSLSLDPVIRPQLTLIRSAPNVILSWPTNATGFVLQSATTLTNGGDWQDSLLSATETNGQKVVPLTPAGARGFFRLHQP
jgi:uncharacterized repeat protein (TIGR03803 family)